MFRILTLLILLSLTASRIQADGQPADLCNGRYNLAQEMLDAAYGRFGTLYSGGDIEDYQGPGVGPSLDLWRLWRGLPDLRFRDGARFDVRGDWGASCAGFGHSEQGLTLLLNMAAQPFAEELSLIQRYLPGYYLDLLVPLGPRPSWWLDPGLVELADPYKYRRSKMEAVIAQHRPGWLLDWLLVTMQASSSQEQVVWLRGMGRDGPVMSEMHRAMLDVARQRVAEGGGLEWWVVLAMLEEAGAPPMDELQHKVADCTASPAEYAAEAVRQFHELYRDGLTPDLDRLALLSPRMRTWAVDNIARQALDPSHESFDAQASRVLLDELAHIQSYDSFLSWLNVGRTWLAGSVAELVAIHQDVRLDPLTLRALNMLSYDDLAAFAEGAALLPDDRITIMTALVGRAIVLGRDEDAREDLRALQVLLKEQPSAGLAAALAVPGGLEVQNARAFLALPLPRVWMRGQKHACHSYGNWYCKQSSAIDLLPHFSDATFLERDLHAWLLEPFEGGRPTGRNNAAISRNYDRRLDYDGKGGIRFLAGEGQDDVFAFQRLIAWDETANLGICNGVTQHVSETLIHYADSASNGWWDRANMDSDDLSWLLRQVILLNRRNPGALVDGKPAGQRAFALLYERFAGTEPALATKYWYHEDRGCSG
jgi:hypothetical protein